MIRLFHLKTCDTCRKAIKVLRARGYSFELVDIRADDVAEADWDAIIAAFGAGAINRRSTTWRQLDDAARAQNPAQVLRAHPTLLKRPAIEVDGEWYQGWGPEVQARFP